MKVEVEFETLPLRTPFQMAGHLIESVDVLVATLSDGVYAGRGEASGVFYRGDIPATMAAQIEAVRPVLEAGVDRAALQRLLPPGGARNALDAALWDLDAQRCGTPAWELAGLPQPQPLVTTYTLGADDPDAMARGAAGFSDARAIKLKLIGDGRDAARVGAVRAARPDVWLAVDGNQAFTLAALEALLPALAEADVRLIEQPLAVGSDAALEGFRSPIPLAADESAQHLGDLDAIAGRYDVVNIKLDKCGGLTEALGMAAEARRRGLKIMVGNMGGTSLALAPAYLLGQICDIVDADGPLLMAADRTPGAVYRGGEVTCPGAIWGEPR